MSYTLYTLQSLQYIDRERRAPQQTKQEKKENLRNLRNKNKQTNKKQTYNQTNKETYPNIVSCLAAASPAIPAPTTKISGLRLGVIMRRSGLTVRGRMPVLMIPRCVRKESTRNASRLYLE